MPSFCCRHKKTGMKFSGKVALFTGGSSGIGADAARHFAKLGASVAIVGRNSKRLNEVAEQIVKDGASEKPLKITADVTAEPERIIDETVKHFGKLDVLVNCAGIMKPDSIDQFDVKEFDNQMNLNVRSVMVLTHLAVPHLEKTKGNVVNLSSALSLKPWGSFTTYSVSKIAIDAFTTCAAQSLAPKRIRVNALNPAMIRTALSEGAAASNGMTVEEFIDMQKDQYLVGRVGETSDTSAAIEYLAHEPFINGVCLPVDGGFTAK